MSQLVIIIIIYLKKIKQNLLLCRIVIIYIFQNIKREEKNKYKINIKAQI